MTNNCTGCKEQHRTKEHVNKYWKVLLLLVKWRKPLNVRGYRMYIENYGQLDKTEQEPSPSHNH
jgi:hypothetical protein